MDVMTVRGIRNERTYKRSRIKKVSDPGQRPEEHQTEHEREKKENG